jgi:hypothetical protein
MSRYDDLKGEIAKQVSGYLAEQARQVAKSLGHDNAEKQHIISRSPQVFWALDAEVLGTASAAELATRELKALGITPKASDPIELLDAHHAGRQHERAKGVLGNRLLGERDSARDSASDSFVNQYINGE